MILLATTVGALQGALAVAVSNRPFAPRVYLLALVLALMSPQLFFLGWWPMIDLSSGQWPMIDVLVIIVLSTLFAYLRITRDCLALGRRQDAATPVELTPDSHAPRSILHWSLYIAATVLLSLWAQVHWAILIWAGRFNQYTSFESYYCNPMIQPGQEFWSFHSYWFYSAAMIPSAIALIFAATWLFNIRARLSVGTRAQWIMAGAAVAIAWWFVVYAYGPVAFGYYVPNERRESLRAPAGYNSCGPELAPDGYQAAALAVGVVAVPLILSGRAKRPVEWALTIGLSLIPALVLMPYGSAIAGASFLTTIGLLFFSTCLAFALSLPGLEWVAGRLQGKHHFTAACWMLGAVLGLTTAIGVLFIWR